MSGWKFILPLLVLFVLFSFFIFPEYQSRMGAIAGEYIQPLDTRMSYDAAEVQTLFEKLGTEGRDVYRFVTGKIDMIYPLVYVMLLMLVLTSLIRKLTVPGSRFALLALLPLGGMLFDYLENFSTLRLLRNYPNITEDEVSMGEMLTRIKHGFLFLSLILVLFLAILFLIKKLLIRRGRQPARRENS
jgi:hypothetical protein